MVDASDMGDQEAADPTHQVPPELAVLLEAPDLTPLDLSLGQAPPVLRDSTPARQHQHLRPRKGKSKVPSAGLGSHSSSSSKVPSSAAHAFRPGFLSQQTARQQPKQPPKQPATPAASLLSDGTSAPQPPTSSPPAEPEVLLEGLHILSQPDDTAASKQAFATLRPVCIGLMQPTIEAVEAALLLDRLQQHLSELPPAGLQHCLSYALLPLMYMVDAAADARSGEI